MILVHSQFKLH